MIRANAQTQLLRIQHEGCGHQVESMNALQLTRIFHTLVAASRQSAVTQDRDESGALTRRRYEVLAVHAECEKTGLRLHFQHHQIHGAGPHSLQNHLFVRPHRIEDQPAWKPADSP